MPPFLVFVSLLGKILAELPGHAQIIEANHHHHRHHQGDSKVLQRIQRKIENSSICLLISVLHKDYPRRGKSKKKLISRVFL